MKRSTKFIIASWITLGIVGFILPAVIGILIGLTPNAVLRQADAGRFITAEAHSRSFLGGGLTTVRTTRGSITVQGPFSSEQGQPLVVRQNLKDPLSLCGAAAVDACVRLAGIWAGPLPRVPHRPLPFAFLVTAIGVDGVGLWFLFAVLAAMVLALITIGIFTPDEDAPTASISTSDAPQ